MRHAYSLENLGSAEEAGRRFLSTTVAPEGSGREADLLSATERCAGSFFYFGYNNKSTKYKKVHFFALIINRSVN